jgi:16S rRNA (guanine1516-N2)-methyltransferase
VLARNDETAALPPPTWLMPSFAAVVVGQVASPRAQKVAAFAASRLGSALLESALLPSSYRARKDYAELHRALAEAPGSPLGRFVLHVDDVSVDSAPRGLGGKGKLLGAPRGHSRLDRTRLLVVDQGAGITDPAALPLWSSEVTGRLAARQASQVSEGERFAPFDIAWDALGLTHRLESQVSRVPPLLKALGWRRDRELRVLDCTGGWGHDALSMAGYGCGVRVCEENATVAALLETCRLLALEQPPLGDSSLVQRVALRKRDAREAIARVRETATQAAIPDAVYLDPMFARDEKSNAAPVKEMQVLSALVESTSAQQVVALVESAVELAESGRSRVVVKVPRTQSWGSALPPPDLNVPARSIRFDVWLPRR